MQIDNEVLSLLLPLRWDILVDAEEAKGCITESKPFKDATNAYAVRNLLLHMHRQKKIKFNEPPENKQMRFGFYKSALLFIGIATTFVLIFVFTLHLFRC